jgi:hypothetical protein
MQTKYTGLWLTATEYNTSEPNQEHSWFGSFLFAEQLQRGQT